MTKNPISRFSGVLESAKLPPVDPPAPDNLAKSKNPEYFKATFYLSKKLHKRLRTAGLVSDREISDIAEDAIAQYLSAKFPEL